ncbi:MAG: hypothetical protein Q7U10_00320 [Thermodesulfovibrionia bacterium]|nr:hypothetical protein [Thermodesulfovibrionia bacterium]
MTKNSLQSFETFEVLGELLCRELSSRELGENVLKKIIESLGEGNRIVMPSFRDKGTITTYYWKKNKGRNPLRFYRMLKALYEDTVIGRPLGLAIFKRVVIELGPPGQRLTVPYLMCKDKTCGRCGRACFARKVRDENIRAEHTGFNNSELANKYNLQPRQIRRIVTTTE